MLEFDPDVRGGEGYAMARDILESGRALSKMEDILQGRATHTGSRRDRSGRDMCSRLGQRHSHRQLPAGTYRPPGRPPMDKGAGVDLLKKLGDPVEKGEPLYRIHAQFPADFRFSCEKANSMNGYRIGDARDIPPVFAEF